MLYIQKTDTEILNLDFLTRYLQGLRNGIYQVLIRRSRDRNSKEQRGWLWNGIYPKLLIGLINAGWEITTVEEVHEFFKKLFASHKVINRHTGEIIEIPDSTAMMDTLEYATYCEKLREYGLEFLGIDIGEPDKNWKQHLKNPRDHKRENAPKNEIFI